MFNKNDRDIETIKTQLNKIEEDLKQDNSQRVYTNHRLDKYEDKLKERIEKIVLETITDNLNNLSNRFQDKLKHLENYKDDIEIDLKKYLYQV